MRAGAALAGGGGLAAGTIALGELLYVSSVTPPTATSSPKLIIGATAAEAPGALPAASGNTVIGKNATVGSATQDSVVIGTGCTVSIAGTPNAAVVIGKGLTHSVGQSIILIGGPYPASTGSGNIMIGSATTAGANGFLAIGYGMALNGSFQGVQIGNSSTSSGSTAVVIGNSASGGASSVVIGNAAATTGGTSNAVVVGAATNVAGGGGNSVVLIGSSITGLSAVSNAIALGTGVDFTGLGSGWVIFGNNNVSAQGFTNNYLFGGADLHTNTVAVPAQAVRWKDAQGLNVAAGDVRITGPRGTGSGASGAIIFATGAVGASSSTRAVVADVFAITGGQTAEVMQDRGLSFINQTSAAGAGGGTLTNAPAAGNPTFWLKLRIGGASFAVPCWPG